MLGKKLVIALLGILFSIVLFTTPAHAGSLGMYTVETSKSEMREAPEKDAALTGRLVRGDKLTIFDKQNGWVKTFYQGKEVWVKSEDIAPVEQPSVQSEPEPEKKPKKKSSPGKATTKADKVKTVEAPERRSATLEVSTEGPLSGLHVVIDPGHGGQDSGAIADNTREKDLTLSTALKTAEELQRQGANVTLTRANDTYLSLQQRVSISHQRSADIFISFHYNAFSVPTVGGINTFYYGNEEVELARVVQDSLVSHVKLDNRGAKPGNFHVIRENSQLAILVELGFMTNPSELKTIKTEVYQDKVARAISNGLKKYFNKE